MTEDLDRLYTPKQTAEALAISVKTLARMEARGEIRRVQMTEQRHGFRMSEIKNLIEKKSLYPQSFAK